MLKVLDEKYSGFIPKKAWESPKTRVSISLYSEIIRSVL
jgi:hypothetical protein